MTSQMYSTSSELVAVDFHFDICSYNFSPVPISKYLGGWESLVWIPWDKFD